MSASNSTIPTSSESPSRSTPVSLPPSSTSSSPPPPPPPTTTTTTTTTTISNTPPAATTTIPPPTSTKIITSTTVGPSRSGESPVTTTLVITSVLSHSTDSSSEAVTPSSTTTSSTQPATLQSNNGKSTSSGGLSAGGKTAVAVVVPVVVVALLVLAGIFLWRKRKQRKHAEEARRKEVEEYNFNPNNDPTLPTVGMAGSEMAEDQSGYRGWGATTTTSHRKGSTTLSGGLTQPSDSGSNPGGYFQGPGSPNPNGISSDDSGDPLVNEGSGTMDSETVTALGGGPAAGSQRRSSIHRGPSNASSSYSAANRSDNSGEVPIPVPNPQDYYSDNPYYHSGPYSDGAYGGVQQPVIRDVSARRNTRIESPSVFPQQGNSGIAQNF